MDTAKVVYSGKTTKGRDIIIRYPTLEDTQAMLDFINELSKEETFISFQGEQLTLDEERKYVESLLKLIEQRKAVSLKVECEGKMIGSAGITTSGKKFDGHVGIFGITVAKEFRGEGIGKILMQVTLDEAQKQIHGLKIIMLGVFSNNDLAHSMYKKFGFIEYGKLPKGVLHRGEYIDHIYMYKQL